MIKLHRTSCLVIVPLACVLLAATACSPVGRSAKKVAQGFHKQTVQWDKKLKSYLSTEEEIESASVARVAQRGFCYKSLGAIECYKEPIPGQESRLVGKQDTHPVFQQAAYPIPVDTTPPPVMAVAPVEAPPVAVTELPGSTTSAEEPRIAMPEPTATPIFSDSGSSDVPAHMRPHDLIPETEEVPAHRRPRDLIPVFEGLD